MQCQQARQLFDAYHDGELPPALATEFGAHLVHCSECRRAFALLEVSGHIIASSEDPVQLRGDFTDRLLACMDKGRTRWILRLRRTAYVAGPLAAAAVIALAFLGVFSRHETRVAGVKDVADAPMVVERQPSESADDQPDAAARAAQSANERALEEWLERTRQNVDAKKASGESLQRAFDMTILQLLDILDSAKETTPGEAHFPGADTPIDPAPDEAATPAQQEDEVEDL
jgi:anti-sigma factor RsiW